MLVTEQPVVVAVCGSPGAEKTTIASAVACRLGVPLLTRDEIKTGLGLSACLVQDGRVQLQRDFHIAGGPFSLRAQAVLVEAARLFATSGVSFVVESMLSQDLLNVLTASDVRVLAVHVVADEAVIHRRLNARAAEGGAIDQQLLAQFQRGEMRRSIFEPPSGVVDTVIKIDTSDGGEPVIEAVEEAVAALLGASRGASGSVPNSPAMSHEGPAGFLRPGQWLETLRDT
jgi:predicted kinase